MRKSLIRGLGGALLYIFAIAISVYNPHVTLTIYILIPFLVFIPVGYVEKVGGDLSNGLQRDENDNGG